MRHTSSMSLLFHIKTIWLIRLYTLGFAFETSFATKSVEEVLGQFYESLEEGK
jgi:hypothetical protein